MLSYDFDIFILTFFLILSDFAQKIYLLYLHHTPSRRSDVVAPLYKNKINIYLRSNNKHMKRDCGYNFRWPSIQIIKVACMIHNGTLKSIIWSIDAEDIKSLIIIIPIKFSCRRNAQTSFVENPRLKIVNFQNYKSDKAF